MPGRRKTHRDLVRAMAKHVEITTPTPSTSTLVEDLGTDLGEARARAAIELGRPLRPSEARRIRAEVLGQQASAGQSKRRPTVDQWLERLSPDERASVEHSERFQRLSETAQDYVLRRRDAIDRIEEEADFRHAQYLEEQALENIDVLSDSREWQGEHEDADAYGESLAARAKLESDRMNEEWREENARWGVTDQAVEAAGEAFEDDDPVGELAGGYDLGEEEDE